MRHVLALCGGRSAEHEVSLLSASSIINRLDQTKYRTSVVGIRKDGSLYPAEAIRGKLEIDPGREIQFPSGDYWMGLLTRLHPPVDIVFPVLHGPFGEDGTVQGALELLDLPYVGAGVWGSAVGMDKIHSKQILENSGLPVLVHLAVGARQWQQEAESVLALAERKLDYPMFVKPANMGSSVGISKSKNRQQLAEHVPIAFQYDGFIVIEQGIEAREVEVAVLGNLEPRASVAGEIVPSREFYSYESKYVDTASQLLIPAPLSEAEMAEIRHLALKAYQALQLEGMARVDFLMDRKSGRFWISEANTIPGFTEISMYPKLWEASGLPYPKLLDELIELGLERYRRRRFSTDR